MREMLDCGVLLPPGHDAAMRGWIERHQPQVARVRFHPLLLASAGEAAEPQALAAMAVTLKRYDACLMPVEPATLAWTRIALQQARPSLATPILVLVDGMKASAIEDLLALGAADFISEPVCLEGLRVRLRHQLLSAAWGLAAASLEEPALRYGAGPGGPRARRPAASSPGRDARSRTGPRVGPGSRRLAAGRDASTRGVGLVRPGHGEPAVAAPLAGRRRAIRTGQGTRGGRVRARVPAARTLPSRRQRGAGRQGVQQAPPRILGVDAQARYRSRAYRIAAARRGQDMPSD